MDLIAKAYAAGVHLLTRREHSVREIKDKLSSKGFELLDIDRAVEKLMDHGYLCEARFARSFLSMRISQGKGPLLIRQELSQRGIPKELIESAEQELNVDWLDIAVSVIAKKNKISEPLDYASKSKLIRYLAGKGFSLSVAQRALKVAETDFYS